VVELWASKRSLNEEMAKALFESPSKGAKARAKNLFKSVNKKINTELDKYAKDNPAFGKAYKSAEEGFAALAQSELLGNFIRNNAKYSPNSILLYPLIHAFPGTSAAAAAGGAGAYKGAQLAYRLAKSKALRTHYKNVLKAAAQGNSGAMNNNLKKMDEELSKQPKDKSSAGRFILED
jgi:ribosomal protein S20